MPRSRRNERAANAHRRALTSEHKCNILRCLYVIDVAAGDKIPSKGGPGITRSDLLVINKVDLAPYVGASLPVMERDAKRMRGTRPFVRRAVILGNPSILACASSETNPVVISASPISRILDACRAFTSVSVRSRVLFRKHPGFSGALTGSRAGKLSAHRTPGLISLCLKNLTPSARLAGSITFTCDCPRLMVSRVLRPSALRASYSRSVGLGRR